MKKINIKLGLLLVSFGIASFAFASPLETGYVAINKTQGGVNITASSMQKVSSEIKDESVMCPMDAKMCDDGTFVGRSGPNCEFDKCINTDRKKKAEKKEVKVCSADYNPVCAIKDTGARCITEPCPSQIQKTYANECNANLDNANIVHEGICEDLKEFKENNVISLDTEISSKHETSYSFLSSIVVEKNNLIENENQQDSNIKSIISSLKSSETEEGRRIIFEQEVKPLLNNNMSAKSPAIISDDKKQIILTKSKNTFEKFDYFIIKSESIYEKIQATINILNEKEVATETINNLFLEMTAELNNAQENKTMAWLKFNMVLLLSDKEEIKDNIKQAKEKLHLSKTSIQKIFLNSKTIVEEIKELIKK